MSSLISSTIVEILPYHTILKNKALFEYRSTEYKGAEEGSGDNCSVWKGGPMAMLTLGEGWNGWPCATGGAQVGNRGCTG